MQADNDTAAARTAEVAGVTVDECEHIALEAVPDSHRIIHANPATPGPDAMRRIARSPIVTNPISTIAAGVCLGILLATVVTSAIAYLLGGTVTIG